MLIAHSLFNNIFFETHPELSSLKLDLEQLEVTYLSNNNDDVNLNNSVNIESQKSNIINDFVETVFTSEQIEKFYQIYHYNIMENLDEQVDDNNELKQNLIKLDEEAQKQKLQIFECCQEKCLQKKIDHEKAMLRYQSFNKLSNNEKNMYLKGIFATIIKGDIIIKGNKKQ